MNSLTVQTASIIGSEEDILYLEQKESARLLVISDSHGESELFEKIIKEFGADCDAVVFCGDGICDITSYINKAAFDKKMTEDLPPVVICARGNGDADRYPLEIQIDSSGDLEPRHIQPYFSVIPTVLFKVAGRTVLCVHGNRHGVDFGTETLVSTAEVMDADMVFFGHTHRIFREEAGPTLVLNPGSWSRPRGNFPPSFAVVSFPGRTERYDVDFFEITETLFSGWNFAVYKGAPGV